MPFSLLDRFFDSLDDLRDAVGGKDVGNCWDAVAVGHAQAVQSDDTEVGWAIDENVIEQIRGEARSGCSCRGL